MFQTDTFALYSVITFTEKKPSGEPMKIYTAKMMVLLFSVLLASSCEKKLEEEIEEITTPPTSLNYTSYAAAYSVGTTISPNSATTSGGVPTVFSISPALPAGLTFDTTTGQIAGLPTSAAAAASYTVVASNLGGSVEYTLSLTVNANEAGRSFSPGCTFSMVHWDHFAVPLANGKVLIGAGYDSNQVGSTVAELYDPSTNSCSVTGSLVANHATGGIAVRLANDKVLVAGGSGNSVAAELYDPTAGTFSATASMTVARTYAAAVLLQDGQVLVVGGRDGGNNPLLSAELYNPTTGTFTATGNMTVTRGNGHLATLLPNGKVLVTGGSYYMGNQSDIRNTAEIYDPAAGTFSAVTNTMAHARWAHAAAQLPNGKVLVAGGRFNHTGGPIINTSADLYDPVTNSFSPTGNLTQPRVAWSSWNTGSGVLLPSGKVLIAGSGVDGCFTALNSTDLYDPNTGTFAASAILATPRTYNSATLLPNGKVLISAGKDTTCGNTWGQMLNSTELFW